MKEMPKILIVDDEISICKVLKLNLELSGYTAEYILSAEDALRLDLSQYSLILLDVMMGRMDGFEFAKHLKGNIRTKDIPIIFCTAKDTEPDLVEGYNSGADDYIKKPFSMKELLLRVKSVLKRTLKEPLPQIISYKTLKLNNVSKICTVDEKDVALTKKEFELLQFLIKEKGKILSRQELLDAVWEEDVYVIDRTIDVNVNRLRKKIGIYGKNIITKLGYGYGFTEEIN